MMVTSDFRPDVLMWPFCACTVKNMQYNPYYILQEQFGCGGHAMGQIPRST